jgi:SAM-dependent methyltransferase
LRQQSGPADTRDARVEHLQAGEFDAAREAAMQVGTPPPATRLGLRAPVAEAKRSIAGATGHRGGAADRHKRADEPTFEAMLQRWRPGLYGQYLYHRYANNSFHASIPLLLLLGDLGTRQPPSRVLELTCGIGHSAFLMGATFPHLDVVATDHDFTNLWIARNFFAPNARLVCLDAEVPLPFRTGTFSAVFCLDGFHYVRSKVALGSEAARVATDDALFLFPHLHNANQRNVHAGIPLTPAGYRRCFDAIPCELFDEATVLRGFVSRGELSLDQPDPAKRLEQAQSLALVATRRTDFWHRRTDLAAPLCADPTKLMPNPLYEVSSGSAFIDLKANWPNSALEAECLPVKEYLPDSLRLDAALRDCLRGTSVDTECAAMLRKLVQSFALVRLPAAAYAGKWQEARAPGTQK